MNHYRDVWTTHAQKQAGQQCKHCVILVHLRIPVISQEFSQDLTRSYFLLHEYAGENRKPLTKLRAWYLFPIGTESTVEVITP